jgi:predicted metal-dependent hydrolase
MTSPRVVDSRARPLASPRRLVVAGLDFQVRSSAGRSVGITVDRDGSLIVTVPHGVDDADLVRFVHEKRMWMYKKLAEKDLLLSRRLTKTFVAGEGFAYLGRSYRLLLTDQRQDPVKLERGRLVMRRDMVEAGNGSRVMIDWYRTRGLRWLQGRVRPWAERMGATPSLIDVRDLGYRWGSRGKHDRLNFHWAAVQLPPTLIDYLIVHELAHLHEPNHSPEFWLRIERAMPGFQYVKDQLARIGSALWLGNEEGSGVDKLAGRNSPTAPA